MRSAGVFAVGGNRRTRSKPTRLRRRPCLLATYVQTWARTHALWTRGDQPARARHSRPLGYPNWLGKKNPNFRGKILLKGNKFEYYANISSLRPIYLWNRRPECQTRAPVLNLFLGQSSISAIELCQDLNPRPLSESGTQSPAYNVGALFHSATRHP